MALSASPRAADIRPEERQFFEQKIRPVLAEQCYECHSASAKKLKAGLMLDSRAGVQRGGDSGEPVVVPHRPAGSLLIKALRHEDDLEMPPKKPMLSEGIIADFVHWVELGAPDPRDEVTEERRADKATWWSLQALANPAPPTPAHAQPAWRKNPIDRFILAQLTAKGLEPNSPADPRTLIRRMTYDITGLPPTLEEVEAFARATRADPEGAVVALVDRLLASPHYGEQWGRHWLDVVRFGESVGFERNTIIENAWPFRDYVIRTFNEDRPFDRVIIEHLAGDVVGKDDPAVEVGTAFLVAGAYDNVGNKDPAAAANIRAATLDDIITTTSGAFLGLTLNCARCHHHKFDPIPTEDYYRVRAAFESVQHGERVIATLGEKQQFRAAAEPLNSRKRVLDAERKKIEDEVRQRAAETPLKAQLRPAPDPKGTEECFPPVRARFVRMKILATADNPRSGAGARLDEFEVWSAGDHPRNVALASAGASVQASVGRVADDFAGAYDPSLLIDGKFGARWFAGNPAELTITLAEPAVITRVVFSNDRTTQRIKLNAQGPYPAEYEILASLDRETWTKVADSRDRTAATPALAAERDFQRAVHPAESARLAALAEETAAVERELKKIPKLPLVWAGRFEAVSEPTRVHKHGDPQQPGDVVPPASPSVLDRVTPSFTLPPDAPEGERRLALARWIVSAENPLTPRVLSNRIWHYHFGVGLVDTPSDFGFLGSRPSHPELLDFLAQRLRAHGWRLKPLHREILLSQTYRQASTLRAAAAAVDQDARLLWRFPPRRLAAEELRDTLLAVSGALDLTMGGPGFRLYRYSQDNVSTYTPLDHPGPETYRRAVYHQNARASVVDLLSDFDLPDNALAAPRRTVTTSPLQALALLNHPFTLDLAEALSRQMGGGDASAIQRAYGLVFQRAARPAEVQAAAEFIARQGTRAFCRALLNANELLYLE